MRIAQVAPLNESVPPLLYGGTERVVSYLTEEMVRQGHEVTLFASGDSQTSARLVAGLPAALWRDEHIRETLPHHVRLMELVFRDRDRFDILHFHCDFLHFPILRRFPCPSVTTLHGLVHPPDLEPLLREYRRHAAGLDLRLAEKTPAVGQLAGDGLSWPARGSLLVSRAARRLLGFSRQNLAGQGDRQGDRDRTGVGEKAQGRGQDLSRGSGLLSAGDRPALA